MAKKCIIIITALLILIGTAVYAEAAERSVVMEIEGMSTALCPIAVKKSLTEIEGVSDVEVSLEENNARLTVEDSVADKTLMDAVKKAGPFKGKIVERKTKE